MAINLDKKHTVNLRKNDAPENSLGKYAGIHGVIRKNEVAAATSHKGINGKGIVGGNYPMDSDKEFEKRVKRYRQQQREAAEAAMQAETASLPSASKMSAVPA